jgi:hypothetical protein
MSKRGISGHEVVSKISAQKKRPENSQTTTGFGSERPQRGLRECICTKYLSSTKFDSAFHTKLLLVHSTEYLVPTLIAILQGTVFVPTSTYLYSKSHRNEFRGLGYFKILVIPKAVGARAGDASLDIRGPFPN